MLELLLAALSIFAGPAPTPPAPPPVILPDNPTPIPPPQPAPSGPVKVTTGHPYIARATVDNVTLIASPAPLVRICHKAEPVTFIDADGNDTTYDKEKSVYFVSAVGKGPCELIFVVPGSDPIRVSLDVGGAGPVPPGPGPAPADPLVAALQTAYAADADADKHASLVGLQTIYAGLPKVLTTHTEMTTNVQFAALCKQLVESAVDASKAKNLRAAIGKEVQSAWGATSAALTAADAAKEIQKVSDALAQVR